MKRNYKDIATIFSQDQLESVTKAFNTHINNEKERCISQIREKVNERNANKENLDDLDFYADVKKFSDKVRGWLVKKH